MRHLLLAAAAIAAAGMVIAALKGCAFLCVVCWGAMALLILAYIDVCSGIEEKEANRRQRERQLRAKNRADIYRIQEMQVKEQLLRDYDKIKL